MEVILKLDFQIHRQVLTSAVLQTIRTHVEIHGGQFKPESLKYMSVSLEEVMGEVLMFGADYWPAPAEPDTTIDGSVVRLFPATEPTKAPSSFYVSFRRSVFWIRIQALRLLMMSMKLWAATFLLHKPMSIVKSSAVANAIFLTFAT